MSGPFGGLFGGSELKLATTVDAYLERLEKILIIRKLAKEVEDASTLKAFDGAIKVIIKKMNSEVEKIIAEDEEAKKSTDNQESE